VASHTCQEAVAAKAAQAAQRGSFKEEHKEKEQSKLQPAANKYSVATRGSYGYLCKHIRGHQRIN